MAGNVETKERAIQYREILVKSTVEKMNEIIGLLKDGRYEDVEKFIMPIGDSGSHAIDFGDGFDIKDTIDRLKELKGMIDRPVSGILDRSIPIAPDGSVEYNGNRYILVQDTDLHPAYGMLSCDRCVFKGKYGLCKKPQYFPLSCVSSDKDIVSHFEKVARDRQDTEMDRETSKKIYLKEIETDEKLQFLITKENMDRYNIKKIIEDRVECVMFEGKDGQPIEGRLLMVSKGSLVGKNKVGINGILYGFYMLNVEYKNYLNDKQNGD